MKTAIILAGGSSKRMGDLCNDKPKCLLEVNKKSIIRRQIEYLFNNDYEQIIIACQEDHIKDLCQFIGIGNKDFAGNDTDYTGKIHDKYIKFSTETEKRGTSGAVKNAMKLVDKSCKNVLVLNCDDITNIDLEEMEKMSGQFGNDNVIAIARPTGSFGIVRFDENNNLLGFSEKGRMSYYVSIGWYMLNRKIDLVDNGDIEKEVFPYLNAKVYQHSGEWFPINDVKQLELVNKYYEGVEE